MEFENWIEKKNLYRMRAILYILEMYFKKKKSEWSPGEVKHFPLVEKMYRVMLLSVSTLSIN